MDELRNELHWFQWGEQKHCRALFEASNRSLDCQQSDFERQMLLTLAESHFEQTFLPSLPMHFEQFCVFLVHGLSQFCGQCALQSRLGGEERATANGRSTVCSDALAEFCPHLVCSEWSGLLRLRAISKTFWRRFKASGAGQALRLYAPVCAQCHFTNAYCGASRKAHLRSMQLLKTLGLPRLTLANGRRTEKQQCVCQLSCVDLLLERLCQVLDWNARQRIVRGHCYCRRSLFKQRMRITSAIGGQSVEHRRF